MPAPTLLMPRRTVPELDVPLLEGGRYRLSEQRPRSFSMIVFYRGYHCPVCARYLRDLASLLGAFEERGVDVVAVSGDTRERASRAHDAWRLGKLRVGYGLTPGEARRWGLYLSSGRGETSAGVEEPEVFNEPGLFLVQRDGGLFYAAVQSMPFARPRFDEVLKGVDFALARRYPARGEVLEVEPVPGSA